MLRTSRLLRRGPFFLPDLGYHIIDGLPPVFSPRQLSLHYNQHHKSYVDNLNTMVAAPDSAYAHLADKPIEHVLRYAATNRPAALKLFNNAAQHYNHSFFWKCLRPGGLPDIPPPLSRQLEQDFGSVAAFRKAFSAAATTHFGSGWVWLVWDGAQQCLRITTTANADVPFLSPTADLPADRAEERPSAGPAVTPVLVCDVWEHAHYVDFPAARAAYVDAFWRVVDWEVVADNVLLAQSSADAANAWLD
eukprot:TRINITY_DN57489_c0_g1_i1.p2 TRINITY_DN57489_c0_g1~~TRINITY_DN57489_c0_g1_i1.p2  ORF type:complete len:248 (+),score=31.39 TRINITY_DN57489_c0_g1_i1:86-829(+)